VVDCYYPVTAEVLLLSSGLRNVFGFGFAFGVTSWISHAGFKRAFGTMAGIQCAVMLFGIPLWYYGKQLRHKTAGWKVISW
jgi:hypothetical protein